MVPYKRPAADKSGVPVYQPNATTYQQLMQLQQPFVPVSCEYSTSPIPQQQQQSSSTCASPSLSDTVAQSIPSIPQQNQSPPLQQPMTSKKENESISITTTATLPALPPQPAIPDPATLAKEVAQQNYAKAVKLAAVNQSLVANQTLVASQFSHLNPLNYTGISLNKQALAISPPAAAAVAAAFPRYPALPFQFNPAATTGLNLGLANPYQAAIAQQNLLNISRPPPNIQLNPYAFIRPTYAPTATAAAAPIYGNSLLNAAAQYPVSVSAAQITNVSSGVAGTTNIAVAAPNNNNNNVVIQPYKKLKTT